MPTLPRVITRANRAKKGKYHQQGLRVVHFVVEVRMLQREKAGAKSARPASTVQDL